MADAQRGQHATYSFLVHSSSSPDAALRFDEPANAKQKRRRTSPHDHAILEAAYQRNSKPDKKERADIVSQVDLGEKEVQIWFQNRRQNDRRKSKPLQPHELIAHLRNGIPSETSPLSCGSYTSSDKLFNEGSPHRDALSGSVPAASTPIPSIHELLNPPTSSGVATTNTGETGTQCNPVPTYEPGQTLTPPPSFDTSRLGTTSQHSASASSSVASTSSFGHRRKRSHEVMDGNSNTKSDITGPPQSLTLPPLKKSSSFVRLAMTVDGAVKVRTNNDPTPSPPKQRLPPMKVNERSNKSLARSQSDVQNMFVFKDANPTVRRAGLAGFGRSRDVRTWEFYCDRDSGDALETQAEAERNGSAVGAINLIRSSSQRTKGHALSPKLAKQNIHRTSSEMAHNKPKISRARSSMARMQNFAAPGDKSDVQTKRPRHERSSSRDSDKENWAPGTRASHNPLRRMHPSMPRSSILQEQEAGHRPASMQQHPPLTPDENQPETPATQAKPSNSSVAEHPEKAKGDDLDCIQSLLSLSQGAWR